MIPQLSNVWDDLFHVFLFGTGGWLGLLVILAIIVLVTYKVRYSGFLFVIVSVFIGITYLSNVSVNSNLLWGAIIMFLTALYCVIISTYEVVKRG